MWWPQTPDTPDQHCSLFNSRNFNLLQECVRRSTVHAHTMTTLRAVTFRCCTETTAIHTATTTIIAAVREEKMQLQQQQRTRACNESQLSALSECSATRRQRTDNQADKPAGERTFTESNGWRNG